MLKVTYSKGHAGAQLGDSGPALLYQSCHQVARALRQEFGPPPRFQHSVGAPSGASYRTFLGLSFYIYKMKNPTLHISQH